MIPEASTHLVISEASEDLIVSEPWTIETYAEGLIDDLFTDIDDILDGEGKRQSQTRRTEYVGTEKVMVTVPEVVSSPASDRTVEVVSPPPQPPTAVRFIVKPPSVAAITPRTEQKKDGWGKMLLVGITASLGTVGLLYLIQSELVKNLAAKTPQTPKQENIQTADPEKELVNYMLQALAVIDQHQQNNNQNNYQSNYQTPVRSNFAVNNSPVNYSQTTALALPSTPSVGTLPPPLTANSLPPVPSQALAVNNLPPLPTIPTQTTTTQTTNLINPGFSIPVYQAPAPMRSPVPYVPPLLRRNNPLNNPPKPVTSTPPKAAAKPPIPTVQPVVNNQPIRIAPPKLPTLTTAKKPVTQVVTAASPVQPTNTVVATQPTPVQPKISAELEGLLELGDKSAALFKVDGISRRISLGEAIGSSGWTLVEVTKGEAVIRRNGEVRSIYVGQKL